MNAMSGMPTVLFVAYGSGHIRMAVPVAQALAAQGKARPLVLALTTAAPVARAAGLAVLQFKDFLQATDGAALNLGRQLMGELEGPVADPDETVAYLGLSMADLIASEGEAQAWAAYRKFGRQALLPQRTLQGILRHVAPQLVVATNSPRAERAAILAARTLGIPAVCLVDLFAIDEIQWVGAPGYADHVCVLNESVRQFLVAAGRPADQVSATGNPAFDALNLPTARQQGSLLREQLGWQFKRVLLWPMQVEPAFHPYTAQAADPTLPAQALHALVQWVLAREDCVLCVRARAGDELPVLPADPRIVVTGQELPLAPLLHATDVVVTLNSTVGLEGHLAGCRLVQVLGSVFDAAMPLARHGIADAAVPLGGLPRALDSLHAAPRLDVQSQAPATGQVLTLLDRWLVS